VHSILKATAFLLSWGVALSAYPQATAGNRITQAIDDRETVQIRGNVHPLLERASDQGRMDGGTKVEGVSLIFKRTAEQDAAVEKLLQEQQDPSSPNYHKWLTPEEYADRFGLSVEDIHKVTSWLEAQGFTVDRVARGRNMLWFTGTASQIETVFRTEMHRYQLEGKSHFAMAVEPAVPAALAEVVLGVHNVSSFRPKARLRSRKVSAAEMQRHYTDGSGNHFLVPDDFATIYDVQALYTAGFNGTGQTIVIVGQSQINTSDIDSFRAVGAANLPPRTVANFIQTLVPGTGSSVIVTGDVGESSLDLEWAEGVAKGVTENFVYVGNASNKSAFDAFLYAIDNNLAPVLSSSYGNCEQNLPASFQTTLQTETQKAAMLGITVVAAAGDFGAADCDANPALPAQGGLGVDMPGSLPYVTSVGGTTFTGDASNPGSFWNGQPNNSHGGSVKSYIPESAWNDTNNPLVNALSATGGGASLLFSKPSWQTGTGVPADGERDVPDVALAASPNHDGYLLCTTDPGGKGNPAVLPCKTGFTDASGNLDIAGGTSFGAPTFAGIAAILLQKEGGRQGNLNPTLYALAASTPSAFHDITSGNNIVPCQVGTPNCTSGTYGYNAGTGYDLVTGLGTIDAANLVNNWSAGNPTAKDFAMFGATVGISAPGGNGTSTITVDARNGYSGTINFTCTAPTSAKVGCTVTGPVTLGGATTSGTVTLSITTAHAGLVPHSAPSLWYTGSGAVFAGVLIFGVQGRRRRWAAAATLLTLALLAAAVGCGGSSSSSSGGGGGGGTPVGNYTVTVTGNDGTTSHSTGVLVSVL
jgi:subtilase family serine protease